MNNNFLIYFQEIKPQGIGPDGIEVSPENPIEIQDIKDKEVIIKMIKESFFRMKMANAKEVSFNIKDSDNKTTLWSGKGNINENKIDITEIILVE
jgi:hypothetical protein